MPTSTDESRHAAETAKVDRPPYPVPRGCRYPGCGKETRAYTEFEGLSYCDEHIRIVKAGANLARKFEPLTGTGEP